MRILTMFVLAMCPLYVTTKLLDHEKANISDEEHYTGPIERLYGSIYGLGSSGLTSGLFHVPSAPSLYSHGYKKGKKKHLKKYKHLLPILLTLLAKLAHILPVAKLILLTLFALVLFAKKAFFISVGTLILVIYDHVYHSKANNDHSSWSFWKDRKNANPTQHTKSEDDLKQSLDDWWQPYMEAMNSSRINPRDEKSSTRRNWWSPQVKGGPFPGSF